MEKVMKTKMFISLLKHFLTLIGDFFAKVSISIFSAQQIQEKSFKLTRSVNSPPFSSLSLSLSLWHTHTLSLTFSLCHWLSIRLANMDSRCKSLTQTYSFSHSFQFSSCSQIPSILFSFHQFPHSFQFVLSCSMASIGSVLMNRKQLDCFD